MANYQIIRRYGRFNVWTAQDTNGNYLLQQGFGSCLVHPRFKMSIWVATALLDALSLCEDRIDFNRACDYCPSAARELRKAEKKGATPKELELLAMDIIFPQ